MTNGQPLVVCLVGPTGTGKTDFALRLATDYPVEIVSVDSALVYRHMNIGTAKPSAVVRAAIPHHLIDIREPWESYSAGQFHSDAQEVVPKIIARGNVPLLVGGTMLYFRALWRGLAPLPAADRTVRELIDSEAAERGWAALHADLARIDPMTAARIRPTDRQRIQRALEVFRLTGCLLSELQKAANPAAPFRFLRIALVASDRAALRSRLDSRLRAMIERGFVAEVAKLVAMPLMSRECTAMRAVGYRQIWSHLAGELSLEEAIQQVANATHQLAKRQLTWLRAEPVDVVLDTAAPSGLRQAVTAMEQAGVSRPAVRCNIMGLPMGCRDHGV